MHRYTNGRVFTQNSPELDKIDNDGVVWISGVPHYLSSEFSSKSNFDEIDRH